MFKIDMYQVYTRVTMARVIYLDRKYVYFLKWWFVYASSHRDGHNWSDLAAAAAAA